jgi:hypothetical protein
VWRGLPKDKDEKITSALKKEWSMLEVPSYDKFKATEKCLQAIIDEAKATHVPYGKHAADAE